MVSVAAGWLAKLGMLPLGWAYVVLVFGDLVGDALHYALGRSGLRRIPDRWRRRLGVDAEALDRLARHFQANGGRTLVAAKLTHSLGFAALIAAGAARMPFWSFLWYNFLATLPKTLAFLMLGYLLGHAQSLIGTWLWRGSLVVIVLGGVLFFWLLRRKVHRT
jgi:membrane protein DedA with SNARE-associated domain